MSETRPDSTQEFTSHFSDPEFTRSYGDRLRQFLPGCEDLHIMTGVLLSERAPEDARVLVLGAGGGLELKAMADAHPRWTFVGVDPAPEMLREAHRVLGPLNERVELIKGYITDAPAGPFDAATCLLTLHFLREAERLETVRQVHRRLRQGAAFVAAHASFPQSTGERSIWLDRYAAFAIASGADRDQAIKARNAIEASELMLTPQADEAILRAGGFEDAELFYSAFTWRGWIAHA